MSWSCHCLKGPASAGFILSFGSSTQHLLTSRYGHHHLQTEDTERCFRRSPKHSDRLHRSEADFIQHDSNTFKYIQIHSNPVSCNCSRLGQAQQVAPPISHGPSAPPLRWDASALPQSHHVTRGTCDTRGKGNQKHPSLEQIQHCTSRFGPEALRFPVGLPW